MNPEEKFFLASDSNRNSVEGTKSLEIFFLKLPIQMLCSNMGEYPPLPPPLVLSLDKLNQMKMWLIVVLVETSLVLCLCVKQNRWELFNQFVSRENYKQISYQAKINIDWF